VSNSPDFVTHALELVAGVGPVAARAMFGGHGLYARGVMFALLDDDELFLKTDDLSRPRFAEAGCRSWVYVGPTQRMENTSYFRPPDEAHEDPEAMRAWAALALESALRLRAAKAARGERKAGRAPAPKGTKAPAKRARRTPAKRRGGGPAKGGARPRAKRTRGGRRPR
jgi:DNA transformation protein